MTPRQKQLEAMIQTDERETSVAPPQKATLQRRGLWLLAGFVLLLLFAYLTAGESQCAAFPDIKACIDLTYETIIKSRTDW